MPINGIAGELAAGSPVNVDGTFVADGTIHFGQVVVQSSGGDKLAKVYAGGSERILGIAMRDTTKGFSRDATTGLATEVLYYIDGNPIAIIKGGQPFVTVATDVVVGTVPYIVSVKGNSSFTVGDIIASGTDVGNGSKVALPAFFVNTVASGGVAKIELNLP